LFLCSCLFIGILLLLVVADRTGSTDNHRRRRRCTDYSSTYTSSSHHFDLLIKNSISESILRIYIPLHASPGKNLQGFIHNLVGDALLRQ
jgi:hypothetical protein